MRIAETGPADPPGIGWHAYVEDAEGNLLGLMQEERNAA